MSSPATLFWLDVIPATRMQTSTKPLELALEIIAVRKLKSAAMLTQNARSSTEGCPISKAIICKISFTTHFIHRIHRPVSSEENVCLIVSSSTKSIGNKLFFNPIAK